MPFNVITHLFGNHRHIVLVIININSGPLVLVWVYFIAEPSQRISTTKSVTLIYNTVSYSNGFLAAT